MFESDEIKRNLFSYSPILNLRESDCILCLKLRYHNVRQQRFGSYARVYARQKYLAQQMGQFQNYYKKKCSEAFFPWHKKPYEVGRDKTKEEAAHSFAPGDMVRVAEGELINLKGKVLTIDGNTIVILPKHEDLKVSSFVFMKNPSLVSVLTSSHYDYCPFTFFSIFQFCLNIHENEKG